MILIDNYRTNANTNGCVHLCAVLSHRCRHRRSTGVPVCVCACVVLA